MTTPPDGLAGFAAWSKAMNAGTEPVTMRSAYLAGYAQGRRDRQEEDAALACSHGPWERDALRRDCCMIAQAIREAA